MSLLSRGVVRALLENYTLPGGLWYADMQTRANVKRLTKRRISILTRASDQIELQLEKELRRMEKLNAGEK